MSKVAVVFGGKSTEYEVSCRSAFNILENIKGHSVIKIGITKSGEWFFTDAPNSSVRNGGWVSDSSNVPVVIDFSDKVLLKNGEKISPDVIFPILHGKNGEDGSVQGLFSLLGIPYVGPGILSSSVCMDKITANIVFARENIPHVKWDYTVKSEFEKSPEEVAKRFEKLGYPLFIKPSNAGSSVGISKCVCFGDIIDAVREALKVDDRIIAEEGLENFREIEVGVIGNEIPECGIVGRVKSSKEVYDYNSKYNDPASSNILPADIGGEIISEIEILAKKAYIACDCRGLSRVDFFLDKNGKIYINEINTLPGFTSISMFPMSFKAKGFTYSEIIDKLLELAAEERS